MKAILVPVTTAVRPEITTTSASGSLASPTLLSPAVAKIFDSFELILAPELVQALAQQEGAVGQTGGGREGDTACDSSYPDTCIPPPPPNLNCGDPGVPQNFRVLSPDPHGFDGDNDGVGCDTESNAPEDSGGNIDDDDGDDGEDTSCHPSYPDTCIPPPPPNLNCDDVEETNFEVVGSDPHGFDGDNDGVGCEDGDGEDGGDEDRPRP